MSPLANRSTESSQGAERDDGKWHQYRQTPIEELRRLREIQDREDNVRLAHLAATQVWVTVAEGGRRNGP